MTVGLVVVSHSADLAAGVRELAAQMAPDVVIAVAGGTDEGGIGTSFERVAAALAEADSGAGVVLLYDLGSALLTTETAVEFADPDAAARIRVVDAPLVEGAVAAAVAAQTGVDLTGVADAARQAAVGWSAVVEPARPADPAPLVDPAPGAFEMRLTVTVVDEAGLHARPAALLVREAGKWPGARLTLGRPGGDPVAATDVLQIIGLGLRQGENVEISGSGTDVGPAAAALAALIDAGLD